MQDSNQGRESQFSGPGNIMARRGPGAGQGLQVTNVDTAQTAIANFINELDANPLPVPGKITTYLPSFWLIGTRCCEQFVSPTMAPAVTGSL